MNVNKVTLVGRVGQSPTVRETAKGKVCTVNLATNSGYGDYTLKGESNIANGLTKKV